MNYKIGSSVIITHPGDKNHYIRYIVYKDDTGFYNQEYMFTHFGETLWLKENEILPNLPLLLALFGLRVQ